MWYSVNEAKGFKRCTPLGYAVHAISILVLMVGGIWLLLVPGVILYSFFHPFKGRIFPLVALPIILLVLGWLLNKLAWSMAERKGFKYDYESDKCTWNASGDR